ncbi:3-deoxy-manno-octulosonate cytidylyltransferase [Lentisphaerota bacterium ZTH]|nr:3-deoxy-manno-octulosonate cytidylyltransferase [Lentisphaerota bacterium]WET06745.1 3-deoxy-manno-octulosonate cytidylyltransferase [Lentisphaerota bacterium ZTH]
MFDNSVAVIPARYASTRFPGKVLAEICGKPMIQWVYERTAESIVGEVLVATDDERVVKVVEGFGGKAVMTSPDHPSGTDRIHEAIQHTDKDIIINVQGDEPLIPTEVVDDLVKAMAVNQNIAMATVAVKAPREELEDPNRVKVVIDNNDFALYFSRSMVPFLREGGEDMPVFLHWGIYGYRRATLDKLVSMPQGRLEACEKLEQLRALENGIKIYVMRSGLSSIGVDTPDDLAQAELKMRQEGLC